MTTSCLKSDRLKSTEIVQRERATGRVGHQSSDRRRTTAVTIEPWVTLQDVAKHLQVVEDTVHRWVAKKGLPAVRAGRVWRFKLSEVDEWLRNGGAQDSQDGEPKP